MRKELFIYNMNNINLCTYRKILQLKITILLCHRRGGDIGVYKYIYIAYIYFCPSVVRRLQMRDVLRAAAGRGKLPSVRYL